MRAVTIWVTESCNLRCKYCYEGKEKLNKSFDSNNMDTLIKFLESVLTDNKEDENDVIISFHGGEPLLEIELIENIINEVDRIIYNNDLIVTYELTTNGTVNKSEFIKCIDQRTNFKISVSIDGNREVNDLYRVTSKGKGSFDEAFSFAKELLVRGKEPRIRMTLTPKTIDMLFENVVFFIEEGFRMVVSVPDYFDNEWTSYHIEQLEMQIKRIYNYWLGLSEPRPRISVVENMLKLKGRGMCSGGNSEVHVGTDGSLYPCTYAMNNLNYRIGNIWTGIKSDLTNELLKKYSEKNIECQGCGLEKLCTCTRCKFVNEIITGEWSNAVPIICSLTNMEYRLYKYVNTNS